MSKQMRPGSTSAIVIQRSKSHLPTQPSLGQKIELTNESTDLIKLLSLQGMSQ